MHQSPPSQGRLLQDGEITRPPDTRPVFQHGIISASVDMVTCSLQARPTKATSIDQHASQHDDSCTSPRMHSLKLFAPSNKRKAVQLQAMAGDGVRRAASMVAASIVMDGIERICKDRVEREQEHRQQGRIFPREGC